MKQINRSPVQSSMIAEMGYEDGTMTVLFKNGDLWEYDATETQYRSIINAPSIGVAFNVVKRGLQGRKVN